MPLLGSTWKILWLIRCSYTDVQRMYSTSSYSKMGNEEKEECYLLSDWCVKRGNDKLVYTYMCVCVCVCVCVCARARACVCVCVCVCVCDVQ